MDEDDGVFEDFLDDEDDQDHQDDRVFEDFLDDEDDDVDEEFDADDEPTRRGDEDGHGFPVSGYHYGEPVPVLRLIPKERWREVMAPLCHATRHAAVNSADYADIGGAMALVGELADADNAGSAAARAAPPPAVPVGEQPAGPVPSPARRGSRQINFRLGPTQYERLVQAAAIFEMRPITLARVLTVAGVDRALYEERRARQDAFAPAPAPEPPWRATERGGWPWPE